MDLLLFYAARLFLLFPTSQMGFSQGITAFVFGTFTVMLTPGGIGAYPITLQQVMYKVYAVPVPLGFAIGWLSWLTGFISIIALGLLSFIFLPIYNKTKNEQPARFFKSSTRKILTVEELQK